jgi:hypothetical protein
MAERVATDCRLFPSESNCSLYVAGTPEEVLAAATAHAVSWHGHEDGEVLREAIKNSFEPAVEGA